MLHKVEDSPSLLLGSILKIAVLHFRGVNRSSSSSSPSSPLFYIFLYKTTLIMSLSPSPSPSPSHSTHEQLDQPNGTSTDPINAQENHRRSPTPSTPSVNGGGQHIARNERIVSPASPPSAQTTPTATSQTQQPSEGPQQPSTTHPSRSPSQHQSPLPSSLPTPSFEANSSQLATNAHIPNSTNNDATMPEPAITTHSNNEPTQSPFTASDPALKPHNQHKPQHHDVEPPNLTHSLPSYNWTDLETRFQQKMNEQSKVEADIEREVRQLLSVSALLFLSQSFLFLFISYVGLDVRREDGKC